MNAWTLVKSEIRLCLFLQVKLNSQAPERSSGARSDRSGTNGDGGSDHSENLTKVFDGAKNGNFNQTYPNIIRELSEVKIFQLTSDLNWKLKSNSFKI